MWDHPLNIINNHLHNNMEYKYAVDAVDKDGDKEVTKTDKVVLGATNEDEIMPPIPSKDMRTITIVTPMGSMWITHDNNDLIRYRDIYHGSLQK